MKADVSCCIIVKNEPFLEQSLKSIRDYVEEIVIIDTGSTDGQTIEIAKKYADIFEIYTECNNSETGLIEDFSLARNRSFELATRPWVWWQDADDLIIGAENLNKLIKKFEENRKHLDSCAYLFPYEYAYNAEGDCTLKHYRERLVYNKNIFNFVNPVHECLIPKEGFKVAFFTNDEIIFKHQRQFHPKKIESGRNLRILKKYYEKVGDSDARQLYYLGLECCNSGLIDESIRHLSKYIDISGWEDEKVMACLKLVDIYIGNNKPLEGLKWAFKTIEIKEDWSEGYFALSKIFYLLAMQAGSNEIRNWQRCIHFAREGLKLPPTKTLLFIKPLEREIDIYRYLNMALNKIGDVKGALASTNLGLQNHPKDIQLVSNKKLYESFLARQQIVESLDILKTNNNLEQKPSEIIVAMINNQTLSENISKWNIPEKYDFNELPLDLTKEQLQSVVVMLWKQYMLYDCDIDAIKFLESVPEQIKNDKNIELALALTKQFNNNFKNESRKVIELIQNEDKLDIVFILGDGTEIWHPQTIKEKGQGGSEIMAAELAKRLASLGHKVRVFNSCGEKNIYDNVLYDLTENYHDLECDVLIVSRRADYLADNFNIKTKLKLLWVHDVCAINATNELLLKADRVLALSEWHKKNIMNAHQIHEKHIVVTRNGIDLTRFDKQIKRNRFKCINSSSPDRSWPILLNIWSRIKEQVPKAELHLFYGMKNWKLAAQNDKLQMNLINRLEAQIQEMKSLDVIYHDRVNQEELAKEMLGAGTWLYSTWFFESSCISAMEMQAAGLRIVSSPIAAINETVGSRGTLIPGEWTSKEYQDKFVEAAVKALTNEDDSDRPDLQKYAKEHFGLDELAKEWAQMFFNLLEEKKINPIIPYQPSTAYRK